MTSNTPVMTPPRTRSPWPGVPRIGDLVRDAVLAARAQIVSTVTLVLVLATVCFAILVTTGQAAANEARIVGEIDSAGTRLVTVFDNAGDAQILPTAPGTLAGLSDVDWVLGLGDAVDVTNAALGAGRAASRPIVGELPGEVTVVQGRAPRPGEAVAGIDTLTALNLGPGLGRLRPVDAPDGEPTGVVGVFEATGPLAFLNEVVLVATAPQDLDTLRYVYVMATDVGVVERLESVLATSTPAADLNRLTVETPHGAIALRDVIAGRIGAASRQLMGVVMGIGAVIIAVTVLSAVISRRRDFGRRRALGATRSALVATLLVQSAVGAVIGIGLGTAAGLVTLATTTGSLPTWQFITGVAGLTLLLTLATAAPIATYAAYRDPLRILRVP